MRILLPFYSMYCAFAIRLQVYKEFHGVSQGTKKYPVFEELLTLHSESRQKSGKGDFAGSDFSITSNSPNLEAFDEKRESLVRCTFTSSQKKLLYQD